MHKFCSCLPPVVLAGLLLITSISASANPVVHFAGFAYSGAYSSIKTSFPYTASLNPPTGSSGSSVFDESLRDMLSNKTFKGFTLNFNSLGNTKNGDSLALAFVLNNESVSIEHIQANVYKLLITLDAEALFFDANKMEIVATYPFGLDYIDALPNPPTKEYIESKIRDIYLGGVHANIFSQFSDVLAKINLKRRYGNTIQIGDVGISDQAQAFLPEDMQANLATLKTQIATQFSNYLSKNADVPVLPYSKGYAISNKIAASFSNGDVFNLAIPTPDYVVTLGVKDFKKILYSKQAAGSAWIYGVFETVKVSEPLSNHVYMDVLAKNGAVKIVPATQTNVDDWPAYEDTLLGLMNQITEQFMRPNEPWIKTHIGNETDIAEFQNVTQVLKSCQ